MKFAICNETFGEWPFDRAFAFARECGYTGIEVAPFTIDPDIRRISGTRRGEVRRQAEQAGVEIIALHWLLAQTEGFHVSSPDPEVRRRTAAYLGDLADFCRDLGGAILVLGSPQQRNLLPGVSHEDGMSYAADTLRQAMPRLEAIHVTLGIEPLAPPNANFLLTAAEGVELMKRVDSPHCRLHLDCKAMASESDPIPDILRANREWLLHFHANDPNRLGPGMGDLDFVPIFAALDEIGYDAWVSVEVFDFTPGPERIARESMANMIAAIEGARAAKNKD